MLDSISETLINSNFALFIIFGTIFTCLFINGLVTLIIAHVMRHSLKWPGNSKSILEAISEGKTLRLCTVIGSGGHTMEMTSFLKQLNPDLFNDRFYIVAETDKLGVDKVMEAEKELHSKKINENKDFFEVIKIPRSREVGQSYFSSIFTTLWATFLSIKEVWRIKPDVVLCNGPGTCLPICIISYILDLFRLRDTRIIFIESICRVKSLSLTGKILYALKTTDVFLVQWKDLVEKYPRTEYIGVLI